MRRAGAGIGLENAAFGGLVVGFYVPRIVGIDGGEARIDAPDQDFKRRVGFGEVAEDDIFALGRHAAADADHQVVAVIGYRALRIDRCRPSGSP